MIALLLLIACSPCGAKTAVNIGGTELCAHEATTDRQRRDGLTAYGKLSEREALILRFPKPTTACITTKVMSYPIDVLYLNEAGMIVHAGCDRDRDDPIVCQDDIKDVIELLPRDACSTWPGVEVAYEG